MVILRSRSRYFRAIANFDDKPCCRRLQLHSLEKAFARHAAKGEWSWKMNANVQLFELPVAEEPEPGQPDRIQHGCDYDFDGSRMNYYYNFLYYAWTIADEEVYARAYLDMPEEISIFVPYERLKGDVAFAPLLRYLQRRFVNIRTFERAGDGYVLRYRLRGAAER